MKMKLFELLIQKLKADDKHLRKNTIEFLGELGDTLKVKFLIKILVKETDGQIKVAIMDILKKLEII